MAEDLHDWAPMPPGEVHDLLRTLSVPWWIAGGWAIDLFVGRQTRPHNDTDVLIRRDDQLVVQRSLSDWDLHKTNQPGLRPWAEAEFLNPSVNDIWCRRASESPWSLQLMLLDAEGESWVFRRDPSIRGAIATLGRTTEGGIPYLSPEIQLLYKARADTFEKDDTDFRICVPLLAPAAKCWLLSCLRKRLPDGHTWITLLRELVQ